MEGSAFQDCTVPISNENQYSVCPFKWVRELNTSIGYSGVAGIRKSLIQVAPVTIILMKAL